MYAVWKRSRATRQALQVNLRGKSRSIHAIWANSSSPSRTVSIDEHLISLLHTSLPPNSQLHPTHARRPISSPPRFSSSSSSLTGICFFSPLTFELSFSCAIMLYRGLRTAARTASRFSLTHAQTSLRQLPVQFHQVRTYADTIVKVPAMAESISEGTLKQWNKQIGDYVEQDEEIATIETDKVRIKRHPSSPFGPSVNSCLLRVLDCLQNYMVYARRLWFLMRAIIFLDRCRC